MPDDELTPEEAQVRRLLADARATEPMPDDVVDRLDGVLADLAAERAADELASRRHPRRAPAFLVAAAAVVAVGFGISRMDDLSMSGSADNSGSAASKAEPQADAGGDAAASSAPPVELGRASFERQVRRLLALPATADSATRSAEAGAPSAAPTPATGDTSGGQNYSSRDLDGLVMCPDSRWGKGTRIAVVYAGRDGVLVVRPPSGGTRVVDLFLCGERAPTRSLEVPAG